MSFAGAHRINLKATALEALEGRWATSEEWAQVWQRLEQVSSLKPVPLKDAWIKWGVDQDQIKHLSRFIRGGDVGLGHTAITGIDESAIRPVTTFLPSKKAMGWLSVSGASVVAIGAVLGAPMAFAASMAAIPVFGLGFTWFKEKSAQRVFKQQESQGKDVVLDGWLGEGFKGYGLISSSVNEASSMGGSFKQEVAQHLKHWRSQSNHDAFKSLKNSSSFEQRRDLLQEQINRFEERFSHWHCEGVMQIQAIEKWLGLMQKEVRLWEGKIQLDLRIPRPGPARKASKPSSKANAQEGFVMDQKTLKSFLLDVHLETQIPIEALLRASQEILRESVSKNKHATSSLNDLKDKILQHFQEAKNLNVQLNVIQESEPKDSGAELPIDEWVEKIDLRTLRKEAQATPKTPEEESASTLVKRYSK